MKKRLSGGGVASDYYWMASWGEGEKAKAMKTEIAGELLRKLSRHSPMIE